MKLTILGSGTYQPELERHSSAYLIQIEGKNICFDFGRGAIDQLMKVGVHVNQIDAVFISHWHGDHVNDLIPLIQITNSPPADHGLWPIRKKPLKIYGPKKSKEKIEIITKIIGEPVPLSNFEIHEFQNGETIELDGFKVSAYETDHVKNPEITALCFRFEAENKVFSYSGDSVETDGLAKAIKGANLAIIEAAWPDEVQPKSHLTGSRVGKIAQSNRVKKLVITHIAPLYLQKYNPKADTEKEFNREVIVAKDLLEIEI